ncbi:unnamed protein product, partial [Hapterophycus canaliculatus]
QQQHSGEQPSSWRENKVLNKRHSSAPPPRRRTTSTSSVSTIASTSSSPDRDQQQPERPAERPRQDTASTMEAPVSDTTLSTPTDGDGSGPLKFPTPTFSPALMRIEDGSFTLASKNTGRRWRAINSTRECQFGEVMRAMELTGETAAPPAYFAIKELSLDRLREMQGRTHEDPLREVAALQYLAGHQNVLTCTEALWDKDSIYIVTPFYSGGEVFDALADRGRFEESEARPLFRELLEGLLHLKKHGVCHRDVSLENLLLAEGGVVKLVDFGLALRIPQTADGKARVLPPQGPCGKPYYMAPEVLASSSSSGFDGFAVDVWACGIVLFMMLTGLPPFELALPSQDQRCKIVAVEERLVDLLSAWDVSLSSEAAALIQSCLLCAPERRPSLETLLSHPWINA